MPVKTAPPRFLFEPLFSTKIDVPPPPQKMVERPRLEQCLDEGLKRRLTLLSAPAGYGKTTLLSEWIRKTSVPLAYVSLDRGDNDPNRFLMYLCSALQSLQAQGPEIAGVLLQTPSFHQIDTFFSALIDEVAKIPENFAIVLDDFHVIQEPSIHEALTCLLDHLPRNLHIILAARSDPPLPLARLRSRGQLNEIRAADLRFTAAEAGIFLNQVMALDLPEEQVLCLESRTEGWIAALQLAAFSVEKAPDPDRFVNEFSGENRYIADYLIEEVLHQAPEPIQDFLLQTSILDRFCSSLCNEVTGRNDSQTLLEQAEHSNLFIEALDDKRCWYRYHHLFSSLLQSRLRQLRGEEIAGLFDRASKWCERNGLAVDAVEYALKGGYHEKAAASIRHEARCMFARGDAARVLVWMEALPKALVAAQPALCLHRARALLALGRAEEAERFLLKAETGLQENALSTPPAETQEVREEINALRSQRMLVCGEIGNSLALCRQELAQTPEKGAVSQNDLLLNLGTAGWLSGDYDTADQAWTECYTHSKARGQLTTLLNALRGLVRLNAAKGELNKAAVMLQHELKELARAGEASIPAAGILYVELAEIHRERNELDAAEKYVQTGLKCAKNGGDNSTLIAGYLSLARILQSKGDLPGAMQAVNQAADLPPARVNPEIRAQIAAIRARLSIFLGDSASACQWAEERGPSARQGITHVLYEEGITLAYLRLAQEQYTDAVLVLNPLLAELGTSGQKGRMVEPLVVKALALHGQGAAHSSIEALTHALRLAEPAGSIAPFLQEPASVSSLLCQVQPAGISAVYYRKLLSILSKRLNNETGKARWASRKPKPPTTPGYDPLSKRELQVLWLLADGLTADEIAEKLVISTRTARTHIRNMYRKLEVHNRIQVIERGRELQLI